MKQIELWPKRLVHYITSRVCIWGEDDLTVSGIWTVINSLRTSRMDSVSLEPDLNPMIEATSDSATALPRCRSYTFTLVSLAGQHCPSLSTLIVFCMGGSKEFLCCIKLCCMIIQHSSYSTLAVLAGKLPLDL